MISDDITYANNEPKHYGFISQEVALVIPEIVKDVQTPNTIKALNYIEIIPLLVEGIKAQQSSIDSLRNITNMQQITMIGMIANISALQNCCNQLPPPSAPMMSNSNGNKQQTMDKMQSATLYQNNPNPFTENTSIDFEIPSTASKASLYIYNLQGEQIKSISIEARGKSNIIINGNDLKAGSYFYTLIVDNLEIDTKKMILTR